MPFGIPQGSSAGDFRSSFASAAPKQSTVFPAAPAANYATGSFQDWLGSLPSPGELTPGARKGYSEQSRMEASRVPAMWLQFARQGEPLINQAAQARRGATISGAGNARRELERNLLNAYQSAGVNPLFARANLAQSLPQVGYQTEQQLGEIEAGRLDDTLGFRSGIQNALAEGFTNERLLAHQLELASKARRDARHAGKAAERLGYAQLLGDVATSFIPKPGGGG